MLYDRLHSSALEYSSVSIETKSCNRRIVAHTFTKCVRFTDTNYKFSALNREMQLRLFVATEYHETGPVSVFWEGSLIHPMAMAWHHLRMWLPCGGCILIFRLNFE